MVEGKEKLETLFDCFLTIISNISPYIKSFCSTVCLSWNPPETQPNNVPAPRLQ